MLNRLGPLGILMALAVIVVPTDAHACLCVGGIPVCETFWKTDAVFAGEVIDISEAAPRPGREKWPEVRVRLKVLESWRGELGATVELTTGAGPDYCGYSFETNGRYLVFADKGPSGLSTGICNRTRKLTDAGEDLEYLRTALLQPATAGRIFGFVYQGQGSNDRSSSRPPLAASRIQIANDRLKRTATSDRQGRFEFKGVPAGSYAIALIAKPGEHANGPPSVTLADPRGCAVADFVVTR